MRSRGHSRKGGQARIRGPAAAFMVALAVLQAWPAAARAQSSASLCVVTRSVVEGLDFDCVRSALALEWKKARLPLEQRVVAAPAAEACPPGSDGPSALLMITGAEAVLLGPAGATLRQDLEPAVPVDRAQDLARRVVSLFSTEIRRGHPVLVDLARDVPGPPAEHRKRDAPAGYITVGGRYGYQTSGGQHRFATDLEGGVSLYDERLQIGLRVGFEPDQEATRDPFRIRSLAVPMTAQLRGGGRVHPRILVRGALGAGFEWRQVSASVPDRPDARQITGTVPLLEAEVEAVVAATSVLRVSVAGLLRGFLGGEGLSWQGRTVYDAPRVTVGLTIRVGVLVRDRRQP